MANAIDLSVADSSTDLSLVAVTLDSAHSVAFSLDGATKVTGKADRKSVTYAKVRKDTDLVVTSRATGVKDELILASPTAPDRFVFPLQLRGLTATIDSSGDVVYRDEAGVERARTPHGFMTDANADPRSGEGVVSTGVIYALIPWGKGSALEVRLDRAWLNDPARRWPVVVDPQVTNASSGDDTYVMSGFYRDNSYDGELKVGTYDYGSHVGRSFLHFDTSAFNGATVTHAELHATEVASWDCNYWPEPVWRVTGSWNGRAMPDWSNQPPTEANALSGGTWISGSCPNRTASWDVTSAAAYWAANPSQSYGLSLRATDEGNVSMWKKYASTEAGSPAVLIVTYDHAPAIPTNVTPTYNQRINSSTTSASARYSDGDGGSGQIAFGLWNYNGQLVWSAWSGSVCNGCTTSVAMPALADGWYYVRAIAWDGQNYSSDWSPAYQWFFIDTRPPNAPTNLTPANGSVITAPTQASAVYSEPYGWAGSMYFWLLDGTGHTVKESWDDAAIVGRSTPSGGTATFALPALGIGTYSVYAMAYDGQLSPQVGPNTFTVAALPGAPSNLQAAAGALSALLQWSPPPSNGAAITSYNFIASDSAGGTPIQATCNGCTSSFTMGGLAANHSYTFTAAATNAIGTGPRSAPSNAITALLASVLAPTNVTAARGDTRATVTWTAPTINIPGITGYTVTAYRSADNAVVGTGSSVSSPFTWPQGSFRNGTPLYFVVSASTLILPPEPSAPSNVVTPAGVPFAPTNVIAQRGNASATISFGPPSAQTDGTPGDNGDPITGYSITAFRASDNSQVGSPLSVTNSPATVSGLSNATTYYFKVQAVNGVGTGAAATTDTVTPAPPPDAPGGATASAGDGEATVSWSAPDAHGSTITSYTVKAEPYVTAATVDASQTTAIVGPLANGVSFTFTVVAHSDVGDSAPSAPSNSVTPQAPQPPSGVPGSPLYVVGFPGDGSAEVHWSPADPNGSAITSYTITASSGGTIKTTGGTATQTTFTGLSNGTGYTFTVYATNAIGNSGATESSNIVVPEPAPAAIDVVLGDSYSAGVGAPPYWDSQCRRSNNAYGPQYASSFAPPPTPTMLMLACGGAKISDVETSQLGMVPVNANNIFLTVGGNDVGFSTVLADCVKAISSTCDQDFPNKVEEINALRPRLAQLYGEIKVAAPQAHIYVLTYPRILTNVNRVSGCVGDFGIDPGEKDWVNARASDLDNVIRAAATDAGITTVSEDSSFAGHEVCTPDQWVNGEALGGASFHPETAGYHREAADIAAVIG